MERTCSFKGCTRKLLCKGLCLGHYTQQRRGQTLRPLAFSAEHAKRDENGTVCKKCNEYKPHEEFYDRAGGGSYSVCKDCQIEAARRNYDKQRKGFVRAFRDENGKVCTRCKEYKPFEEYYRDNNSTDGKQSRCGKCQSKAQRERYRKKKEGVSA
ncbi:hypothetical protein [Streptomyces sp. NPDC003273]|uniref:hypothetical protein n=1 Tax=Streptomyces sp. NPDC003273 TaxID=3364678 RepID=UPI00368AE3EB